MVWGSCQTYGRLQNLRFAEQNDEFEKIVGGGDFLTAKYKRERNTRNGECVEIPGVADWLPAKHLQGLGIVLALFQRVL
jgi:hypothetical protein